MSNEAKCEACRAPIVFIRTLLGKAMPCDPELLAIDVMAPKEKATTVIITDRGQTMRGEKVALDDKRRTALGRVSHFATCTNPFRRAK